MSKLSRRRLKAIHFCVQMAADNGSTAILRLLYEEGIVICYLLSAIQARLVFGC